MALGGGVTYGQQQAVQHRNILLVQRDQKAANTGDMRVFFSEGIRDRLVEEGSWLFLEEGNAYLAVKAFSREDGVSACAYGWDNEFFIRLGDRQAPVVFMLGRKAHTPGLEDCMDDVLASSSTLEENGRFPFHAEGMYGDPVSLSLYLNGDRLPELDGVPVDLNPELIYDSPYLNSVHGSGLIQIRKGEKSLTLDFN